MPPRKRTGPPVAAPKTPMPSIAAQTGRKVTRTITVDTTADAADAIAKRNTMDPAQVLLTFEVERIAGPRDTNARWRFNLAGPMLVVAEDDLAIIDILIQALKAERLAKQL